LLLIIPADGLEPVEEGLLVEGAAPLELEEKEMEPVEGVAIEGEEGAPEDRIAPPGGV
jgi:hypothetical protein